jgi:hypothetical protein
MTATSLSGDELEAEILAFIIVEVAQHWQAGRSTRPLARSPGMAATACERS